jgi:YQGE family putative transporter
MAVSADDDRPRSGLTSAERHLIEAQGLFSGAAAVAGLFLNLYLFKVGGTSAIAWYQIVNFMTVTVVFVVVGFLLRRRSTRPIMQVGLLVLCAEYLLLLTLGNDARHVVVLLGFIEGVGQGLFWAGTNVNEYVVTHRSTRALYIGKLALWQNSLPAASLLAAGGIIAVATHLSGDRTGYFILFGCMIVVFGLTIHHVGGTKPLTGVTFSLRDFKDDAENPLWRYSLAQQFLRGAWSMLLSAFAGVLVYVLLHTELRVSIFMAASTIVSGVAGMVAGRVLHEHPTAYVLGATVVPLGLIGFGLGAGWIGLACYIVGIQAFDGFGKNPVDRVSYDAQEHSGADWQHTYHYFVEREIALNAGRISGFIAVLVLLSGGADISAVRNCLITAAALPPLTGLLQWRIHRLHQHHVD